MDTIENTRPTVNLYTMPNCPKCKVLKEMCEESPYFKYVDFQICEINPSDKNDAYMLFLQEKGVENMPVLLVDDDLYDFAKAVTFIRNKNLYFVTTAYSKVN